MNLCNSARDRRTTESERESNPRGTLPIVLDDRRSVLCASCHALDLGDKCPGKVTYGDGSDSEACALYPSLQRIRRGAHSSISWGSRHMLLWPLHRKGESSGRLLIRPRHGPRQVSTRHMLGSASQLVQIHVGSRNRDYHKIAGFGLESQDGRPLLISQHIVSLKVCSGMSKLTKIGTITRGECSVWVGCPRERICAYTCKHDREAPHNDDECSIAAAFLTTNKFMKVFIFVEQRHCNLHFFLIKSIDSRRLATVRQRRSGSWYVHGWHSSTAMCTPVEGHGGSKKVRTATLQRQPYPRICAAWSIVRHMRL